MGMIGVVVVGDSDVNLDEVLDYKFRGKSKKKFKKIAKSLEDCIMRETIYDMWNSVMNADHNPLKHIPSLQTRHMIYRYLQDISFLHGHGGFQWLHTCVVS